MRQVPRPQREFEDVDTESVALTMAPSLAPTTATRVTALAADDGDDSLSTIKVRSWGVGLSCAGLAAGGLDFRISRNRFDVEASRVSRSADCSRHSFIF